MLKDSWGDSVDAGISAGESVSKVDVADGWIAAPS